MVPKLRRPFCGVLIVRIIVSSGPTYGNYHVWLAESVEVAVLMHMAIRGLSMRDEAKLNFASQEMLS